MADMIALCWIMIGVLIGAIVTGDCTCCEHCSAKSRPKKSKKHKPLSLRQRYELSQRVKRQYRKNGRWA